MFRIIKRLFLLLLTISFFSCGLNLSYAKGKDGHFWKVVEIYDNGQNQEPQKSSRKSKIEDSRRVNAIFIKKGAITDPVPPLIVAATKEGAARLLSQRKGILLNWIESKMMGNNCKKAGNMGLFSGPEKFRASGMGFEIAREMGLNDLIMAFYEDREESRFINKKKMAEDGFLTLVFVTVKPPGQRQLSLRFADNGPGPGSGPNFAPNSGPGPGSGPNFAPNSGPGPGSGPNFAPNGPGFTDKKPQAEKALGPSKNETDITEKNP